MGTDVNDFFRRIFTAENDLGFPDFPAIAEVVSVIHQAGGVAICAHLASDFHGAGMQEYLPRLVDEELDGFECYHSGHRAEDSRLLAHFCRRHKLYISGGSDCHGSFVPSSVPASGDSGNRYRHAVFANVTTMKKARGFALFYFADRFFQPLEK